ncbi:RNA polymerase II transcription factor B 52 kDa subunit [Neophaeococcomyces mojaviensis]|uniref:RNA polymerase II transcription factor B 52 kDa subunit n=1 Tax=Neophaeococcomyces mojaviensis TaxID=3383035 RepID=A0ACC2ZVY7_9EURO|nr:RNA polymerase II transcription factor B 52 kDa subunit [Knufia sp. JES_112]
MADSPQSWEYLEHLQGVELNRLYRSPPSTLAIFRKILSGLAKHFVMTMLYSPRPTPVKDFELMVKSGNAKERQMAIDQLRRYSIIKEATLRSGKAYALSPDFARSLRQVIGGGGIEGQPFGEVVSPATPQPVSIDELDDYARQQWEGILGFMVGSSNLQELQESGEELPPPGQGVIELLKAGRLISVQGTASRGQVASITKEGFAFVLKDVNAQIWELLFLYVDNADQLNMDKIDVLSFIFFIASLELGLAYSTASFDRAQHQTLQDLIALGIVYQPLAASTNGNSKVTAPPYFYPTRLATTLTSSSSTALATTSTTLGSSLQPNSLSHHAANTNATPGAGSGFIIIETNYRLYAYTSSPLQIALLSLFINLRSRHPNLVTGKLTKSSVQRAINIGITADQIISYLTTHAHPQMRRFAAAEQARLDARKALRTSGPDGVADENDEHDMRVTVVPQVILDQIKLWQLERDRIVTHTGYLLKDFTSHAEYIGPCNYADELGVLVWKDDKRHVFFVSRIEGVQRYIKDRREAGSMS